MIVREKAESLCGGWTVAVGTGYSNEVSVSFSMMNNFNAVWFPDLDKLAIKFHQIPSNASLAPPAVSIRAETFLSDELSPTVAMRKCGHQLAAFSPLQLVHSTERILL